MILLNDLHEVLSGSSNAGPVCLLPETLLPGSLVLLLGSTTCTKFVFNPQSFFYKGRTTLLSLFKLNQWFYCDWDGSGSLQLRSQ